MTRRRYRVDCRLGYEALEPGTFIFNVALARSRCQRIAWERLEVEPARAMDEYVDRQTRNRFHRLPAPGEPFTVRYSAEVDYAPRVKDPANIAAAPPEHLPLATLPYLHPSRYCQHERVYELANREFGHMAPGYEMVAAICDWIHGNVEYLSGSTDETTAAHHVADSRAGVCRDFAHLAIALCRALNIPARFVSGYAHKLPQPDFHAAFEAWLGDRWYLFDATRQGSPAEFLRIGTGRDAADVPFACIFGRFAMLDMEVSCEMVEDRGPATPALAAA